MAAPSSIETHPQSALIIEAIGRGVPGVEIARRYGLSESAISRYKVSRKNILTQILDEDGADPSEVVGRLIDLSDSARLARKLADATGSPAIRARVITAELSVLERLSRLSVDDTSVARLAQAAGPLVRTIRTLAKEHPQDVLNALAQHEELDDFTNELKTALRGQMRKTP